MMTVEFKTHIYILKCKARLVKVVENCQFVTRKGECNSLEKHFFPKTISHYRHLKSQTELSLR